MRKIMSVLISLTLLLGLTACAGEPAGCEELGHEEGEWEAAEADYVSAEQHYEKKCTRCGEILDSKTETMSSMHSGKEFLLTPDEFIARVNMLMSQFPDAAVTAQSGTAHESYACVYTSGGEVAGYLSFLSFDPDSDETVYADADGSFGGLLGLCYSKDSMAEFVLSVMMTLHPDLSVKEVGEMAADYAYKINSGTLVEYDNVQYSGNIGDGILVFTAIIPQK